MELSKMQEKVNKIKEKLPEEQFALISEDMTELITENETLENDKSSKTKEIEDLTNLKNNLVQVNGNLMQKVGLGNKNQFVNQDTPEPDTKPTFSFYEQFDEKGNFKIKN